MKRIRDTQRSKVYSWECKQYQGDLASKLTLDQCETLTHKAFYRYRPANTPPRITDGRGTRRAMAYGSYKISLPVWARMPAIVLHEVAHSLTSTQYAWHGPEFMRLMCDLWKWHTGQDYVRNAKDAGLKVAGPSKVQKPVPIRQNKVTQALKALEELNEVEYKIVNTTYHKNHKNNLIRAGK